MIDVHSETWVYVRDWAMSELERTRNNLEAIGLDMADGDVTGLAWGDSEGNTAES